MKIFLLTVALCAAVGCATAAKKRDVSHLFQNQGFSNEYLPPNHEHHHHHHEVQQQYVAPQPQLNNQYLAPVVKAESEKQSIQLPSTNYGVPFKPAPVPQANQPHREVQREYLAPVQPKLNNQYLAPVAEAPKLEKESFQLPAIDYGVPFRPISAPAPIPERVSSPTLVSSYGTPVIDETAVAPSTLIEAPEVSHVAPVAETHRTYGAPLVQPQHQQHFIQPAPQPVPQQTYGGPIVHSAPVHQAPVPFLRSTPIEVVDHQEVHRHAALADEPIFSVPIPQHNHAEETVDFKAPIKFIDYPENHNDKRISSAPLVSAPVHVAPEPVYRGEYQHNQQQVASNGGYVY